MAIRVSYDPTEAIARAAFLGGEPEGRDIKLRRKRQEIQDERQLIDDLLARLPKPKAEPKRGPDPAIVQSLLSALAVGEQPAGEPAAGGADMLTRLAMLAPGEESVAGAPSRGTLFAPGGGAVALQLQSRQQDFALKQAAYEQQLKAQGFELQYTLQDKQRMAELNRGMQWVREQHANGTLNDEEAKQGLLDLHNAFYGIAKSRVPVQKQPTSEEMWKQRTYTDPAHPGYVFSFDDKGVPKIVVDPTKQKDDGKTRLADYERAYKMLTRKVPGEGGVMTDQPPTHEEVQAFLAKIQGEPGAMDMERLGPAFQKRAAELGRELTQDEKLEIAWQQGEALRAGGPSRAAEPTGLLGLTGKQFDELYELTKQGLTKDRAEGEAAPTSYEIYEEMQKRVRGKSEQGAEQVPPEIMMPEKADMGMEQIKFLQTEIQDVRAGKKPVKDFSPTAWGMYTDTGPEVYQHYIQNSDKYANAQELLNADPNFLYYPEEQQKAIYRLLQALGLWRKPTVRKAPEKPVVQETRVSQGIPPRVTGAGPATSSYPRRE